MRVVLYQKPAVLIGRLTLFLAGICLFWSFLCLIEISSTPAVSALQLQTLERGSPEERYTVVPDRQPLLHWAISLVLTSFCVVAFLHTMRKKSPDLAGAWSKAAMDVYPGAVLVADATSNKGTHAVCHTSWVWLYRI